MSKENVEGYPPDQSVRQPDKQPESRSGGGRKPSATLFVLILSIISIYLFTKHPLSRELHQFVHLFWLLYQGPLLHPLKIASAM